MYSPVHATAGFFIARAIPNPVLGIVAAVASHYVLDAIPHGDAGFGPWLTAPGVGRRVVIVEGLDLGSAALMVAYLVATHPDRSAWYLVAGAAAGILPDLIWGARYLLDRLRLNIPGLTRFVHLHDGWHAWGHAKAKYDLSFRAGLIFQGVLLGLVLLLRL